MASVFIKSELVGDWINLPMNENDLNDKIIDIIGIHAKFTIDDYENMPFDINENDSIYDINNFLEFIEKNKIHIDVVLEKMKKLKVSNKYDITNYSNMKYYIIHNITNFDSLAQELAYNHNNLEYYIQIILYNVSEEYKDFVFDLYDNYKFGEPFKYITNDVIDYIDWDKIGRFLYNEKKWILTDNNKAIIFFD